MDRKYKIPFALAILSAALVGCSSNKVKEEKVKPNPLSKIVQATGLVQVFSQSVSSTAKEDPLRLRLDADNGKIFLLDPNGKVEAYQGKHVFGQKKCLKMV